MYANRYPRALGVEARVCGRCDRDLHGDDDDHHRRCVVNYDRNDHVVKSANGGGCGLKWEEAVQDDFDDFRDIDLSHNRCTSSTAPETRKPDPSRQPPAHSILDKSLEPKAQNRNHKL